MSEKIEDNPVSGKAYEEFVMPKPTECLMKSMLVLKISRLMHREKVGHSEMAHVIKRNQKDVSDLVRGRFHNLTVDEIIGFHYDLQTYIMNARRKLRLQKQNGSSV